MAPDLLDRFRGDLAALGCAPAADRRLGIAVSGGPDSVALLLLAHAALPGAVAAATVDHGLRPDAADEARMVGDICAGLGVPHAMLAGAPPAGASRQAQARALRYRLLAEWAADAQVAWIATAHHLNDQAETFLMRAARGAGVGGMAGVRAVATIAGARIVRPLLGWRRTELAAVVAAAGLTAVDDPANHDRAHDRTAFRALLADAALLRPDRLARAAANLAEAEEALAWAAARIAGERLIAADGAVQLRDPASLPGELRRRLVLAAMARVSGPVSPRGDAVDALIARLERGEAATLAEVVAKPGANWTFAPAPPRRG